MDRLTFHDNRFGAPDPATGLPVGAGLGLKPEHYADILETEPEVAFFEIHAENYMGEGGPPHRYLAAIAARYPLSLHGVGLSIGGEAPLDIAHLARLRRLVDRYRPRQFSEHLAWSTHESAFFNDLLPLPYTQATLDRVSAHVAETQDALGCRMLLENPATYVTFAESTIHEIDFLAHVAARTGCGLLLDVNNVMVSAVNHRFDPQAYLDAFPLDCVGEIHLGGHEETVDGAGDRLLIDTHSRHVTDAVFTLYERVIARAGALPTLVEWDSDVTAFETLLGEAQRVDAALRRAGVLAERGPERRVA